MAPLLLHVSPSGDDFHDGSYGAPVATIERALALTRAADDRSARISLQGGDYFLQRPLRLDARDNGLVIEAADGAKPRISGGQWLDGWRFDGGLWRAPLPAWAREKPFTQAWRAGENGVFERLHRPRFPAQGFLTVAGPLADEWSGDYQTPARAMRFAEGDLNPDWHDLPSLVVTVLHFWTDTRLPIARLDRDEKIAHFAHRSRRRLTNDFSQKGARYFVENVREALQDGQFYCDRIAGEVLYAPRAGESGAPQIVAPHLEHLLEIEGAREVEVRGLCFAHTDYHLAPGDAGDMQSASTVPGAIRFQKTSGVSFRECEFSHLGTYALEIGSGCRDSAVENCRFFDLGAGGLKIDGGKADSDLAARTVGVEIRGCTIHHFGRNFKAACGVLSQHAAGVKVRDCHIHDGFYTGVSFGWVWRYGPTVARDNLVENCRIHDLGQGLLSDLGGVYTLGVQPGTVIRNNVIYNVRASGYGGAGIYLDEGSSEIVVENNVVWGASGACLEQHFGKDNRITGNFFDARGGRCAVQNSRPDPESGQFILENNTLIGAENPMFANLHGATTFRPYFESEHNRFWSANGGAMARDEEKRLDFAQWQERFGLDLKSQWLENEPERPSPVMPLLRVPQ